MIVNIENLIDAKFDFDYVEIAKAVCSTVLKQENCPFDCEINITITDNSEIQEINNNTRNINKPTDVLSFPNLFFDKPALFEINEEELSDYLNPENDLIMLGDIILSYDKIIEQSEEYGHSVLREYAFLIAHSMLHLSGFDHMEDDEAKIMEEHQKLVMNTLQIGRE